jgi:hypothetical protein
VNRICKIHAGNRLLTVLINMHHSSYSIDMLRALRVIGKRGTPRPGRKIDPKFHLITSPAETLVERKRIRRGMEIEGVHRQSSSTGISPPSVSKIDCSEHSTYDEMCQYRHVQAQSSVLYPLTFSHFELCIP